MLRRWWCLWCWLWLPCWGWASTSTPTAVDAPRTAVECTAQIVRTQATIAPPSGPPPHDLSQHTWHNVTLPDNWALRWPEHTGAVWYRIDWQPTCTDRSVPLAWLLRFTVMAAEIYLNNDLLERDLHLSEPLSRGWNLPRFGILPASALQPGTNHLWVRVHGHRMQTPGLGEVRLGPADSLHGAFQKHWWQQRTITGINLVVSAVLGLMFGCVWLLRPKHPASRTESPPSAGDTANDSSNARSTVSSAYGWYALNAASWVVFNGFILMREPWPLLDTIVVARINIMLFVLFVTTLCVFTWRFGGQQFPRLERAVWVLAGASWLCAVWIPEEHIQVFNLISIVFMVISGLNTLQFPVHAWRTRQLPHQVFAVCMLLFTAIGLHDFLLLVHLIDGFTLVPYTAPITMLALSLVLGRQVVQNMLRIQQFNHELRHTVQQACDELSHTLAREHALAIEHSRLQERMHIAHDLHDSLGGSLVRSIAYVEQAREPLHNQHMLSMLKLMRDDLRQMIDHGTSHTAEVPSTPAQWLAPLRHRFMELFDVLGLHSEWIMPAHWGIRPSALQCLCLTRVTEEALTNILKHSRATRVRVELLQPQGGQVLLRITDNGVGFDVEPTLERSGGVGMRSMRTRMERVHGGLHIRSEPGHTVLEAFWGAAPSARTAGADPRSMAANAPSASTAAH